jgi:hypothetical protein
VGKDIVEGIGLRFLEIGYDKGLIDRTVVVMSIPEDVGGFVV